MFNAVMIIPTGIGCEIGGHSGDATPAANLLAKICDNLIIHPNVVNASDINEMADNCWYVEGSMLDRFLEGDFNLKKYFSNRILVVTNKPIKNNIVNSVSAARATLGIEASILGLEIPLRMLATIEAGKAGGQIFGYKELIKQVKLYNYDALAIITPIIVDKFIALNYMKNGGINPWGGVEAIASKLIAKNLNKPVAHAPIGITLEDYSEIVDPRMAAEIVSISYMHCVLKGLHKAPRISTNGQGLNHKDINVLISPHGCYGKSHKACEKANIPIIMVKENKTVLNNNISKNCILVENYLEAAGLLLCMKIGIQSAAIRRPLRRTEIEKQISCPNLKKDKIKES